jgi:hypothetical protein
MTMVDNTYERSFSLPARTARGLGWVSIALGVSEAAFPNAVARAVGLAPQEMLVRGFGLREIAAGVWALQRDPTGAMWARVLGDLMDLATLAKGLGVRNGKRVNAQLAFAAVGAITLLDIRVALALTRVQSGADQGGASIEDKHEGEAPAAPLH